jgi:hypothetical protein
VCEIRDDEAGRQNRGSHLIINVAGRLLIGYVSKLESCPVNCGPEALSDDAGELRFSKLHGHKGRSGFDPPFL